MGVTRKFTHNTMRTFAAAAVVATASAQLDFGNLDLGNLDLSAFDLSNFGLPAAPALPAVPDREVDADFDPNDERYFFTSTGTTSTTTTTTTQTPPHGTSCWKCDQMTYNDCAIKGKIETCPKGDKDCCFVEVRETRQKITAALYWMQGQERL